MQKKEDFIMYAINANAPYIVQKEDVVTFFSKSKMQEGVADKIQAMFKPEDFNFEMDENGFLVRERAKVVSQRGKVNDEEP